jgi:CysZ protein
MSKSEATSFRLGVSAVGQGFRALIDTPPAWGYVLVPAALFVALESAFVVAAVRLLRPWVALHASEVELLRGFGAAVVAWLSVAAAAALGWFIAALLAPALSATALERIVALVEQQLGVPARRELGFLRELWCGLKATLLGAAFALPLLALLTLVELIWPPGALVTTPLKMLVGALGVAWGLFDYPLTLRNIGVRQRLALLGRHRAAALGFGASFAALFWLPCCGILLLPVGVAGATRLLWQLDDAVLRRS